MIYIKKGPPPQRVASEISRIKRDPAWRHLPKFPPTNLLQKSGYVGTLRAYFNQLPKADIRQASWEEQRGLCAYCMRQLPDPNPMTNADSIRIEHWFPLSKARDTAIDYKNMLAVCDGIYSENHKRCACCDRKKSGEQITIDPRNQAMMDWICYESTGRLYCDFPNHVREDDRNSITKDINDRLCLNSPDSDLISGRKAAYRSCMEHLDLLRRKNQCTVSNVHKLVSALETQTQYPEYVGVMLFCYKRWLKKHSR